MNPRSGVIEHHCMECRRLAEAIPRQDIAAEFVGRRPAGSRVRAARRRPVVAQDADSVVRAA